MRKILDNSPETKKYLDSLPKLYTVFLWAKWTVVEVPWSGERNKNGVPLVYVYYDCNGACDEWHLVTITQVSSGCYYNYFETREAAEVIRRVLNKELGYDDL